MDLELGKRSLKGASSEQGLQDPQPHRRIQLGLGG